MQTEKILNKECNHKNIVNVFFFDHKKLTVGICWQSHVFMTTLSVDQVAFIVNSKKSKNYCYQLIKLIYSIEIFS